MKNIRTKISRGALCLLIMASIAFIGFELWEFFFQQSFSIRDTIFSVIGIISVLLTIYYRHDDHDPSGHEETRNQFDVLKRAVEKERGVPLKVSQKILEKMDVSIKVNHPHIAEKLLWEKAEEYLQLKDQLNKLGSDDSVVSKLRQKAIALFEEGLFDDAKNKLKQAEKRNRETIDELEKTASLKRIAASEDRAARAEIDKLSTNPEAYRSAAEHFAEAAKLVDPVNSDLAHEYRIKQADVLYDLGNEFGDNNALQDAITLLDGLSHKVDRRKKPDIWSQIQNGMGNALRALGERESGTDHLEQAVAAFQEALTELTRDRVPLGWAMVQVNLGCALVRLGERDPGTDRLKQAVVAYKEALKVYTRNHEPLLWAGTHTSLGVALATLGARESGTDRLDQAVAAFEEALKERTRDRVPLDWAMTQNTLGNAFRALGERESGIDRLKQAVAAFQEALKERTQDRVPLAWAMTQNNLGSALAALGELDPDPDPDRLKQAVDAFEEALKERTRDRVPLNWAMTQNNLGNALVLLGKRDAGTGRLDQAVAAFQEALKECTRDRVPLDWAMTQNNLGNALTALGKRETGTDSCQDRCRIFW